MASVSDRASSSADHSKQNNTDGIIQQRHSQEEIDAAYALLALSNPTQAASPPGYKTAANKPGAKLQSAKCSRDNQLSLLSQAASEQRHLQTPQIPELIPASQVSPLVELNTFVATTLPVRDESYVFNPAYHVSQPRDFTVWRCENHGSWSCQQCFHAVNP